MGWLHVAHVWQRSMGLWVAWSEVSRRITVRPSLSRTRTSGPNTWCKMLGAGSPSGRRSNDDAKSQGLGTSLLPSHLSPLGIYMSQEVRTHNMIEMHFLLPWPGTSQCWTDLKNVVISLMWALPLGTWNFVFQHEAPQECAFDSACLTCFIQWVFSELSWG